MPTTIRVQTTVLPGGKVEVDVPGATAGQSVEVTVTVPDPVPADKPPMGIYDLIMSFKPGPRSAESWEEIERQFQEERNSWDR
jgi:hypothetical protein